MLFSRQLTLSFAGVPTIWGVLQIGDEKKGAPYAIGIQRTKPHSSCAILNTCYRPSRGISPRNRQWMPSILLEPRGMLCA
jgi:hypothetical protein